MKKSLKAFALIVAAGTLAAGSAFTASAASLYNGQWCSEADGRWWYKLNADGSTFLANTWYWIKDTDGVTRCYYFDQDGWLQTNTTIDGNTVDGNGRWVVDGTEQVAGASQDYATSIDFAAYTTTSTEDSNTASPLNTTNTASSTGQSSKNGTYKSSGQGDNPTNANFAQEYANSTVSGYTATNSWANFAITLPGAPSLDPSGAGTDWYYDTDNGRINCSYRKLDEFTAGNTDYNSFVNSYINSAKGFAKYKVTRKATSTSKYTVENLGNTTLGNISFLQLRRELPDPSGSKYDYAYLRQIAGTNYVQVIEVLGGADYSSTLATITTVG